MVVLWWTLCFLGVLIITCIYTMVIAALIMGSKADDELLGGSQYEEDRR